MSQSQDEKLKAAEDLMKTFQRGFPNTKAGMVKAHDAFADGYGTIGWLIEQIRSNQYSSGNREKSGSPARVKQVVVWLEKQVREMDAKANLKDGGFFPMSVKQAKAVIPVIREWLDWND